MSCGDVRDAVIPHYIIEKRGGGVKARSTSGRATPTKRERDADINNISLINKTF